SLRQNIHDELVLSGDSLPDALVDVVKRDLRRVQLALARPFLLANVAHYRMPRATMHITITRIIAPGLSVEAANAAHAPLRGRFLEGLAVAAKLSGARTHKIARSVTVI